MSTSNSLGALARSKPFLYALVGIVLIVCITIVILVGLFGVSLKTKYFEISAPARRNPEPSTTAPSKQGDHPTSSREAQGDSPTPKHESADLAPATTIQADGKKSGLNTLVTPSPLLIPVGSSLTDGLGALRGRQYSRVRVQGGELLQFHQDLFGLNWDVSELFVSNVAVSATLTRAPFAQGREGTPAWTEATLTPVSTFCFGTGYQALRGTLDKSMQLVSGQLNDETPSPLDSSLTQPCPEGKSCNYEWTTRYGEWIYRAPGMREVTFSLGKSDYAQYEFVSGGYDRTVLRRQRCEMRLVFSGQFAPTSVPLSLLP